MAAFAIPVLTATSSSSKKGSATAVTPSSRRTKSPVGVTTTVPHSEGRCKNCADVQDAFHWLSSALKHTGKHAPASISPQNGFKQRQHISNVEEKSFVSKAITMTKKEVVALLLVFIVYVLIGGAVFMALERPYETQMRGELVELQEEFQEKLSKINHPNLTQEDIRSLVARLAVARANNLIDDDAKHTSNNWSFYNAFFFAITVVTTIGYGHLAPSTSSGRIFCMFYATVGIPLTGILLAAIGDHFSKQLLKRTKKARRTYTSKLAVAAHAIAFLLPWLTVFMIVPAVIFMFLEKWTYLEAIYYCFISLATIGFGDYVAGNFEGEYVWIYKTMLVLWIVFGLGYLAMILNFISRGMRCKKVRRMERKLSVGFQYTQQKFGHTLEELHQMLQEFANRRKSNKSLMRQQSCPSPTPETPRQSRWKDSQRRHMIRDQYHNREFQLQQMLALIKSLQDETRKSNTTTTTVSPAHTINTNSPSSPHPTRSQSLPDIKQSAVIRAGTTGLLTVVPLTHRGHMAFSRSDFDMQLDPGSPHRAIQIDGYCEDTDERLLGVSDYTDETSTLRELIVSVQERRKDGHSNDVMASNKANT